jgi:hypothetical protein
MWPQVFAQNVSFLNSKINDIIEQQTCNIHHIFDINQDKKISQTISGSKS